jgi:hypothetical protein
MKRRTDGSFPVWLLADSPPKVWAERLEYPLDARHPTRHSIWTPICDVIQRYVYADQRRLRFNDQKVVIHNAIGEASYNPPSGALVWDEMVMRDIEQYCADHVAKTHG